MTEDPLTAIRWKRRRSIVSTSLLALCTGLLVWGCGGESEGGLGFIDIDGPRIDVLSLEETDTAGFYRIAVRAWDPFGGVQVKVVGGRPIRDLVPTGPIIDASPRVFQVDFSDQPGTHQFEVIGTDESGNTTKVARSVVVHPRMACGEIGYHQRNYPPASLVEDSEGGIWALGMDGLMHFDFSTFEFRRVGERNIGVFASLVADSKGMLWAIGGQINHNSNSFMPDSLVSFDKMGTIRTHRFTGRVIIAIAQGSRDSIRGIWGPDWSPSTAWGYGYFTVADTGIIFRYLDSSSSSLKAPSEMVFDSSGLVWLRFPDSLVAYRFPSWEKVIALRDDLPAFMVLDTKGRLVLEDSSRSIRRMRVEDAWVADTLPTGERRCLDAPGGRTWCLPWGKPPLDPVTHPGAEPETSYVSLYRDGVLVRRHVAFSHYAVGIVDAAGRLWTTTGRLTYGATGDQEVCGVSEERF